MRSAEWRRGAQATRGNPSRSKEIQERGDEGAKGQESNGQDRVNQGFKGSRETGGEESEGNAERGMRNAERGVAGDATGEKEGKDFKEVGKGAVVEEEDEDERKGWRHPHNVP